MTITLLVLIWICSALLIAFSFRKYSYISLWDVSVLLSWFYVFLRPIFSDECNLANPYLEDAGLYKQGVLVGAFLLISFQIGLLLVPIKYISTKRRMLLQALSPEHNKPHAFLPRTKYITFSLMICLLGLTIVGPSLLYRFNSDGGALSLNAGFTGSIFFGLIRQSASLLSMLLAYSIVNRSKKSYILIALSFVLLIVYAMGKRGALLSPFLLFISLFSFQDFLLKSKLSSFLSRLLSSFKLSLRSLAVSISLFSILYFLAYVVFKLDNASNYLDLNSKTCAILLLGGQEFDQMWPGLFKLSENYYNLLDLPFAFLGQFIPHSSRIVGDPTFWSITDKFNLLYNRYGYINLKFGISPNVYQTYFAYFGYLSFVLICFVGSYARRLEVWFYSNAFCDMPRYIFFYTIASAPAMNFDFAFKYRFTSSFLIFVLFLVFSSLFFKNIPSKNRSLYL